MTMGSLIAHQTMTGIKGGVEGRTTSGALVLVVGKSILIIIFISSILDYPRCGICGDPWDARVREHEAPGGKFATGVITRNYSPGQQITVTSHITANHVVRIS